jgi:hypothetical protein
MPKFAAMMTAPELLIWAAVEAADLTPLNIESFGATTWRVWVKDWGRNKRTGAPLLSPESRLKRIAGCNNYGVEGDGKYLLIEREDS